MSLPEVNAMLYSYKSTICSKMVCLFAFKLLGVRVSRLSALIADLLAPPAPSRPSDRSDTSCQKLDPLHQAKDMLAAKQYQSVGAASLELSHKNVF